MNYKWLCSYSTYKFDTIDGALHPGEFCVFKNMGLKQDKTLFVIYSPNPTDEVLCGEPNHLWLEKLDTKGLTEIHVIGERAFDVFQDPDTGTKIKESIDLQTYKDLALPNANPRAKTK